MKSFADQWYFWENGIEVLTTLRHLNPQTSYDEKFGRCLRKRLSVTLRFTAT